MGKTEKGGLWRREAKKGNWMRCRLCRQGKDII